MLLRNSVERSMEKLPDIHPLGLNLRSGAHKEGGVGASLTQILQQPIEDADITAED
jgi:hypothetical protein